MYLSPPTGPQRLGVLPTAQQLHSAAVNQFSSAEVELPGQALITASPTSITPAALQGSQSGTTATTNATVSTSEHCPHTTSWLYGDTPTGSPNTLLLSESTSPAISIGPGLPLLPKKLIRQIKAGEFVNFSNLPPAKTRPSTVPDPSQMSILALLQLQEVESQKKLIPDFLTWSQCFAVYTAVLGADQPQRLAELMAYQFEMAKYARKYRWPSWVVYDINYRQEAAGRPSLSWAEAAGHREAKLFSQCFTGMAKDPHEAWCRSCQSLDHSTSNCPIMPSRKTPHRAFEGEATQAKPPEICRNYNTKGCNFLKCHRRHICLHCGAKHPRSKCPHHDAKNKH